MTATNLTDGRVFHLPAMPFAIDADAIVAPDDAELADYVPLIPAENLLPLARRLMNAARKRQQQPRWRDVNRARLALARMCLDRALASSASH